MTRIFEPLQLRGLTLANRIVIPPMCMYQAERDGTATDWHLAHYGALARGGAAAVFLEATAVEDRGRISHADLGLWSDAQVPALARIARFMKSQGCVPGIQLAHAGRKGSARRPWHGNLPLDQEDVRLRGESPWDVVAPSAVALGPSAPEPRALSPSELREVVDAWGAAARRAYQAGFEVLEIHAAHGYLIHQFLSAVSNRRTGLHGGEFDGRARFLLEVVEAVRAHWPQDLPLLVRVSSIDGVEGGWTLEDTVALARKLKAAGVDAIDCSSGGMPGARVPRGAGFQVPYARAVRREAAMPTVAVGLITTPEFAAQIIDDGDADLVAIGREALVDPNWPARARTRLQPQGGFSHWPQETGWWLDNRARYWPAKARPTGN